MINIKFHKLLYKYTNDIENHKLDITSYSSLLEGLQILFPDLYNINKEILMLIDNNDHIINDTDFLRDNILEDVISIRIVPCLFGGKGAKAQIGIGLALIAASVVTGGLSTAGFAGSMQAGVLSSLAQGSIVPALTQGLFGLGVNLILSGLLQVFAPKAKLTEPTLDSSDQRRGNDLFEGLTNTTDSSQAISLHYGQTRVGGQLISGYVKSVNHQKNDIIEVGDYV